MTSFDRPYTTFYWSAIVTIALSCAIFELFDIKYYRDLAVRLEVIETGTSRKLVRFSVCRSGTVQSRTRVSAYSASRVVVQYPL